MSGRTREAFLLLSMCVLATFVGLMVLRPVAAGGKKAEAKKGVAPQVSSRKDRGSVPWPYLGKRRQASAEEISQWLKDLGARDYKVRENASKALLEVGQPAVKELEQAARTGELEIQRRARQLLERIEVAEALAPTIINVALKDTPVPAVVAAVSRQSRIKLEVVPQQGPARQQLDQKKISVQFKDTPFWEALAVLCREGGLTPTSASLPIMQLQLAEGGKSQEPPSAYTGPFRMRITGMNYYRNLTFGGGPGQPTSAGLQRNESLTVSLDLLGETHMTLLNVGTPTVSEAIDETGEALAMPSPVTHTSSYPQPYYSGNMNTQSRQVQFNLRPSTKPASRVRVLRGSVPVEIIAQRKPLIKVDDILNPKVRVVKGEGDLVLAILQVQDHGGGNGRNGYIRFFLSGLDPSHLANPGGGFNPNMSQVQQRLELTDAQGRRISANINVNMNFNNFNGNANVERSVEGHINFNASPNEGAAARLSYNNNQTIRTSVPFEFRDVPMP